jgi:hypothetical protein
LVSFAERKPPNPEGGILFSTTFTLYCMITFDVLIEDTDLKNQEFVTITLYLDGVKIGVLRAVRNKT